LSLLKETLSNTKEAMAAYVVSLLKHKEPLPLIELIPLAIIKG